MTVEQRATFCVLTTAAERAFNEGRLADAEKGIEDCAEMIRKMRAEGWKKKLKDAEKDQ